MSTITPKRSAARRIAEKFNMSIFDAQYIVKALQLQDQIAKAETFEDLKAVLSVIINNQYAIDPRFPIEEIKAELAKEV